MLINTIHRSQKEVPHDSGKHLHFPLDPHLCNGNHRLYGRSYLYPCTTLHSHWTGADFSLSLYLLNWKRGTISYCLYLLIGLAGLPVFSGFSGGIGKLAGPTGGYIIGFIPMAIIAGIIIDHFRKRWIQLLGMIIGTAVCYVFGTAWFCMQAGYTVSAALAVCVIPFIPGDLIKMIIALTIGPVIRQRTETAIR